MGNGADETNLRTLAKQLVAKTYEEAMKRHAGLDMTYRANHAFRSRSSNFSMA